MTYGTSKGTSYLVTKRSSQCREVEICKFSPGPCTTETRKVCEQRPVMEQVSKDIEFCVPKPVNVGLRLAGDCYDYHH